PTPPHPGGHNPYQALCLARDRSADQRRWGYSTVTTGTSLKQLTCDQGMPDGLRTVSHLTMPNGNVHTLHASQGSGKCIDGSYSPMRGTYTLRVCLRNGAYGTDRHCDQNTFQY
ncbi:hypothetical protein, partial [Streptomyces sp. PSKA30]|uniref:hypothetical protein n=1 Tax=Streptomyces sp. PSKA30 TaxID=2874597 RepID=UPI001CD15D4E